MRWLKSTTQKVWTIEGRKIPACVTDKNEYLNIDESVYTAMLKNPVVRSLMEKGQILVLDREPAELKNSLSNLQQSNASLQARNTELQMRVQELENAGSSVAAIKKESLAKDAEIAELKAQLASVKKASKKDEE